MASICFVCLGNICRSPMAHALALHRLAQRGLADAWSVDSCGTGAWHVGKPADSRTMAVLERKGISYTHRARQLAAEDFTRHTWLLAMDPDNAAVLHDQAPAGAAARIAMLIDWDPEGASEVPDPYYGGPDGFDDVFNLVDRSLNVFLDDIA